MFENLTALLVVLMVILHVLITPAYLGWTNTAQSAGLFQVSNEISTSAPGVGANHALTFTTVTDIPVDGSIDIEFESDFVFPAGIDHEDVDVLFGGAQQDVDAIAGSGSGSSLGVSITAPIITINLNDIDAIQGGTQIEVRVGENATHQSSGAEMITNPLTPDSYEFTITTKDSGGTSIDQGFTMVAVIETVSVSATVGGDVGVQIQWAVPELRVGAVETNDDATFAVYIHSSTEGDADYTEYSSGAMGNMPGTLQLLEDGTYTSLPILFTNIPPGTYDVLFKTHQHLAKKLDNVVLTGGLDTLNFSTLDNSTPKGSEVLLAGDISNSDSDPTDLGDNVVNSVDISILLNDLDMIDGDGNTLRANVNQDAVVNSVDLSILLKNLDDIGDAS